MYEAFYGLRRGRSIDDQSAFPAATLNLGSPQYLQYGLRASRPDRARRRCGREDPLVRRPSLVSSDRREDRLSNNPTLTRGNLRVFAGAFALDPATAHSRCWLGASRSSVIACRGILSGLILDEFQALQTALEYVRCSQQRRPPTNCCPRARGPARLAAASIIRPCTV